MGRLKQGATFINTARAEVVDYDALSAAVRDRGIRVGLDVFRNEPASATGEYRDDLLQLPGVYGTHHIGASTDQAQEAIAAETVRIVASFRDTGRVPNVVNLAIRTPATHRLIVRHRDRPGVLAHVFDHLRRGDINVQETENIVFDGARGRHRAHQPGPGARRRAAGAIRDGNADIISLQLVAIYCDGHANTTMTRTAITTPNPNRTRIRLLIATRTPERHFHDHRDTRPQFLLRSSRAASARARAGPARARDACRASACR